MAQNEVKNKAVVKFVGVAAGIFGEIQGIVWTICSLLCILCYFGAIDEDPVPTADDYGNIIYFWFLRKPDEEFPGNDIVIKQSGFFGFMWIYFFLSLFWTIESCCILWAMVREKWELTKYFFTGWCVIGALSSILDIIFMSILAADLKAVQDLGSVGALNVAYGIVMTMAARGYILLVINIALTILTGIYAKDLWNNQSGPEMPIIYGYETETINPPWAQDKQDATPWASSPEYRSPYYSNQSFTPDNNSHGFERSQSFLPAMPPSAPSARPAPASSNNSRGVLPSSSSDKTAHIGKPGGRSPQSKGPMIPDPDYSPPGTPNALKSVLRSKSNY